jgi:2-methylisocitrate lyase-like PEP mutase family enzyme
MGFFSVGFVLSGLYAAAHALDETYREIRRAGSTTALRDRMLSFEEFNSLVGVDERFAEDERYRA